MKSILILSLLAFSSIIGAQNNTEEELILKSKPSDLYGTLLVPENHNAIVALIIPGSGPTNRDGNSTIAGNNNSLKYLAEDLAKNGISSLRIDKRGVGKSMLAMPGESELRFDTYINDVIDWGYKILNDVRFKQLIIIGHSEGSLVGMAATEELEKELNVKAYISIAGAGYPIDQILTIQLSNQPDTIKKEMEDIFKKLKNNETVDNVSAPLFMLFRPSIQPYMASWIKYVPAEEIKKIESPVLILNGTTDIQVSVDNAEKLHEANPKSEIAIIEGMNHVLKEAPEDKDKNMATYANPDLKNVPELIDTIVKFITSIP